MLFLKAFSPISLLTATSIVSSFFIVNLPAKAATLSSSEAILLLSDFSITPQNPSVKNKTKTIAASRDDLDFADAKADVNTIFSANSDSAFFNTDFFSDAFGDGNSFFGLGESSSSAIGNFSIEANQTLSFNFETALVIFNEVDSSLDSSASSFSRIDFSLLDDNTNRVLSDFTAIGNVDTNLAEEINKDFIFVDSDPNIAFNDDDKFEDFGENVESAELFLTGSFQQFFDTATQVRLEITTQSRSCVQAPLTKDPCTKVPEPNNTVTLLFGFLGLGLVSRLAKKSIQ